MNNIYGKIEYSELKDGLSGIMRVKNEALFIEDCIDSCIDALDELIIVYNDCTDETPAIVEKKRRQYPDKIKVYPYNYHILATNLTKEEFESAMGLPDDSPLLFCSYCNFALSKVKYKYAMLIDADQLYFADEIKVWRDICSGDTHVKWNLSFGLGWLFMMHISFYRRLSAKRGYPCLYLLPQKILDIFLPYYWDYAKWRLIKKKSCIALSGLNVFKDDKWYIPFDGINIHPPYNGSGDHLIFPVSDQTYFYKRSDTYSIRFIYAVMESFHCPYKSMIAGPVWFHLHANREYCWDKVKAMKDEHPECFVPIEDFPAMSYKEVHDKMDKQAHSLYERIFFALVHKMGVNRMTKYIYLLK